MNRIIKFKAKRLDNGEWVEGDVIHKNNGIYIHNPQLINKRGYSIQSVKVDPSTVCQFTGLKDKGDNPIWEHDIVNKKPITEIIYKCGTFILYSVVENVERFHPIPYYLENNILSSFKVICSKFDKKEGKK